MADRTVTIFSTTSADGEALAEGARAIASECGYHVRVSPSPTTMEVAYAARRSGIVVFDATIDANCHNYHAATYSLLLSEYCVVLSRSYLPMNFQGHLEPIAPPYPEQWTNSVLLPKLRERLIDLASRAPEPASARSMKGMFNQIDRAQALVRRKREGSFDVFLSYRGSQAQAAQRLVDEASREQGKRVQIIRTDDLSFIDEIVSLQRRWQILRGIFDYLSAADEFWVLWSDDYLGSWWTQGEVVALANMTKDKRPALHIRSVGTANSPPSARELTPRLTRRQRHTIIQRFILCNLPESIVRIRSLAAGRLARILLGLGDDRMLEPSFMETPMLDCARCAGAAPAVRRLDVDAFLQDAVPSLRPISARALRQARTIGVLECPVCQAVHRVTGGPPRYWWYPVRREQGTGPGGAVLEERPLYRAQLEPDR